MTRKYVGTSAVRLWQRVAYQEETRTTGAAQAFRRWCAKRRSQSSGETLSLGTHRGRQIAWRVGSCWRRGQKKKYHLEQSSIGNAGHLLVDASRNSVIYTHLLSKTASCAGGA